MTNADNTLSDANGYAHWTRVTIRFSDQDSLGHVNNAAYAVWFEASRVVFIEPFMREGIDTVLARITIDFLQETHFPGEVEIGARLLSVGNKSFSSGYGIFRDGVCLATASCVNVFFDPVARRSIEPPKDARDQLIAACK